MDLFENYEKNKMNNNAPLADRVRPEKLEDFLGQEKIIDQGKPLRRNHKIQSLCRGYSLCRRQLRQVGGSKR